MHEILNVKIYKDGWDKIDIKFEGKIISSIVNNGKDIDFTMTKNDNNIVLKANDIIIKSEIHLFTVDLLVHVSNLSIFQYKNTDVTIADH